MLAFKFASFIKCQSVKRKLTATKEENKPAMSHHFDTSELVALLQKSAVEHLTTFRQFESQRFGYLGFTTITDFDALYSYKHGQYQRCLQLSTQNVRTLIGHPAQFLSLVFLYPEITQLMDDDIVSVLALALIVDPSMKDSPVHVSVDHLIMSVYLMVKCQMQLHHSVTSLTQSIDYIQVARRRHHEALRRYPQLQISLDIPVMKLVERIVVKCIRN